MTTGFISRERPITKVMTNIMRFTQEQKFEDYMCCTLKKKITSALFKYDQPNIYTFHLGILSALTSHLTCVVRTHLRQLNYFLSLFNGKLLCSVCKCLDSFYVPYVPSQQSLL